MNSASTQLGSPAQTVAPPVTAAPVVTDTVTDVDEVATGSSFKALYIKTTVVMTVAFVLGIWLPTWYFAGDSATGLGVGAMCAVWGGPGFGAMAAGAMWSIRQERSES